MTRFLNAGFPVRALQVLLCILAVGSEAFSQDTSRLHFPIRDQRVGEARTNNPYDLRPSSYSDSVVYDPATRRYTVYQKIGDRYYRSPMDYTFDEYWAMRNRQAEIDYFRTRADVTDILNRGRIKPNLKLNDGMFNRLFGNGKIKIEHQGNVDITAGYMGQRIDNPTLPERARKIGGLDFDMNSQVSVNANIGDKLKFPINYNTLANFDLENQLKLDYTGKDDEIVKRFEAGNVMFPTKSTLIPGAQQLFGVKTQLQFGKLYITGVIANQKSQRQSMDLQGGAAAQEFTLRGDEYEENRHFLLAQYFKDHYNEVMSRLPAITSPVQILKLQVWVTNRTGATVETRDVVGLMDLGEVAPYGPWTPLTNSLLPQNNATNLYSTIISQPNSRLSASVFSNLTSLGLSPVQDFEKTFARKLDSTQYTFNAKAGTLSLNLQLMPDEVLGVAYQYSYNGRIYQVGEFSEDLPPVDTALARQQVLYLKMLKATSQRTQLPIWDLMMKNVYTIGYGQLSPADFKLDVLYDEPGLGTKRYVPIGDKNQGTPVITLLSLDRLNNQLDPQPDGVFDYVEGYTVVSNQSRIIFPVLEPFGRDLARNIYTTIPANVGDSLYYVLYDSIKAIAQQYPNLNRFVLKGRAKTTGSSDISIGYNIPVGSVSVTAGGRLLQEGVDYDINYDLGTIKITNQAILNAGLPVQVNYENNATFGMQQRSYMGLRFDYLAKNTAREQLTIGGTAVRLSERPFFTKVNLNEDPIRNAMYGLDANYHRETPRLTKWVNRLPFYSTTAPSSVNAFGEVAMLDPGHAPQIGRGKNGVIYIDDFEGSNSGIDLRFPATSWTLASTPYGATDLSGAVLFPEAGLSNNLDYGKNRAKLAWYQIEQTLQQYRGNNNPIGNNAAFLSDPRQRIVYQKEIFPQRSTGFGETQLLTFDMAYYPRDKGPYNYDDVDVNADGTLKNPYLRWGGMMRMLDQTDFETANIEFVEFWAMDPFLREPNSNGGELYINLGNVSEDVLKDGKRFYENGLPTPNAPAQTEQSIWGRVPVNPNQVTNAFSNVTADREFQDQGFDGLSDTAEVNKRAEYLSNLASNIGTGSEGYQKALSDPSSDNFKNYRDPAFTADHDILARYKNFNSPQGNSQTANTEYLSASTLYPDAEDLNRDNTLNETEEYFQYIVKLKPSTSSDMDVGTNYIVDKKPVEVSLPDGTTRTETWYQFRIPVGSFSSKVGNIPDFKSIRFIRMFMTGFEDSVVLRFGELQLTRNMWRKFKYKVDSSGVYSPATVSPFDVGAVNIEENDRRQPLPYRTPREIERVQSISNNGVNLLMNEQAMSLNICNLKQGDAKAVIQTFANRDLRQFKNLQMYIHAEDASKIEGTVKNDEYTAVVRVGSDFVNNYYEVRIPLKLTAWNSDETMSPNSNEYNDSLWNPLNSLNLDLHELTRIKQERNLSSLPLNSLYSVALDNGQTYSIMGNPNLGEVKGILLGVENTYNIGVACLQVWFNELRLSSINEQGGYAATGRVDVQLADLGTISVSGNMHTAGFGTLEQRVNERYRDNFFQFDVATNLELGKLLPKKAAMQIPFYASYTKDISTPQYDPYDMDIKLKDKLRSEEDRSKKDSIRNNAVTENTTKTVNFTNVKRMRTSDKKPKVYDIENFDISYSYLKTEHHSPLIKYNDVTKHRGALGYNFVSQPKYYEPFRKMLTNKKTKWLNLIREFNLNYVPSQISFRADLTRQFGVIRPRSIGAEKYEIPETYDKYFTFQRDYIVRWNLTRKLLFDYVATNNSRIDEPEGRIDTRQEKDSIWKNLLRGGRNTLFNQTATFTYGLPTEHFPALDWTTVNLSYQAQYRWIGASRLAVELGNIIENGQQAQVDAQLDFNRLYQKSKWLKQLDQKSKEEDKEKWRNRITKIKDTVVLASGKKVVKTIRKVDQTAVPYLGTPQRIFGKLLTSIKTVGINYGEQANTRLPGYTDSTQIVGMNWRSMAPGLDFVMGYQPDSNWLNRKANKGLITKDSNFNYLFQQNYAQTLQLSAMLQPVRDLNINVNLSKSFNKDYSETFKWVDTSGGNNPQWMHLTPYTGGGFDVTWISLSTMFEKYDPNKVSGIFKQFEANRLVLSRRLGQQNPYTASAPNPIGPDGYYYGYGRYAVDVLIPSFIAAYSGKDPETIALIDQSNSDIKSNPFRKIMPKPNWRLDYTGLSRIKGLDKIFTNLTLNHGYTNHLSMNSFQSALLYQDVSRYGYPSFYDTLSNNYIPYFLVPNVSIQEQFAPLAGLDMQLTNQVTARLEWNKSRTLSLSLYDYQLSETRSQDYFVSLGWRKRGLKLLGGLKLPKFLSKEGDSKLDNDIRFQIDFRMRDNVTNNSRLDQDNAYPTSGSRDITISPTIDYVLNNRVMLKLYYDQRRVKPYLASSAPTTNTRAGVQVRISLAP